jgi:glycosyltransferase involved in cell wall biosynthesis
MISIKFSVAIPAYKSKFLKECIESIITQTYKNFELIIVNDASPEDIDSIVNEFKDERIRYYKNDKNFGAENVVDNWNKCLSFATGEYFVLMGDDDKMESIYLEEFTKLINKYPNLNVYHCRSYIIDEKSEKVLLTQSWPEYESVYENIWHRINGYRNQYISDFVYQTRSLIEQGGFYKLPLAWASDDISAYIAMRDKGIAHTNKPIFNYRKHNLTISTRGDSVLKMKAILEEKEWFDIFFKDKVPQKECDRIVFQAINHKLQIYCFKKKADVIARSLNEQIVKYLFFWLNRGKKYKINKILVFYGFCLYLKNKQRDKHMIFSKKKVK